MYYLVPSGKFNTYDEFKGDERYHSENSFIIETDCDGPNKLISKKYLWTREKLLSELELMTGFLGIYEKYRDDIEGYMSWSWKYWNKELLSERHKYKLDYIYKLNYLYKLDYLYN